MPDPCLGYLPGIAHACCGHGKIRNAYCCGWDGCKPNETIGDFKNPNKPGFWVKRGKAALEYMLSLKNK